MTLWKGRLSKTSEVLKHLNDSLHIDIRLFPYDTKLNTAWAEELKEVGVINEKERDKIKTALAGMAEEYYSGAYVRLPDDEDVHSLVERRLTELTGDAGRKIHTGKSRNDQVVTDLKLYLKEMTGELVQKIGKLNALIAKMAEENIKTIMPGYTHLKQAQPISLAHYLMSLAYSLKDDSDRINTYAETNLSSCPLGCGALAGTALNVDRDRLAKRLGFKRATDNSIQSTSDRAFVIELASALAIISMHLSRYAEDFIIWNSTEFSFIELSDTISTGSSMMPQKKNPDSLELIRAVTGTTYGNLVSLLTITKGVPLSYAKDLQDDKKFIFESLDLISSALDLFYEVMNGIKFNSERMSQVFEEGILATDLADVLVARGIPFRKAHEEVARLVKTAAENKKGLTSLTEDEISKISPNISIEDLKSVSLEQSIERKTSSGGTASASVMEQIKRFK